MTGSEKKFARLSKALVVLMPIADVKKFFGRCADLDLGDAVAEYQKKFTEVASGKKLVDIDTANWWEKGKLLLTT